MNDDMPRGTEIDRLESSYRREKKSFLRFVRRTANSFMDAEDVVHDAFVSALSRIDSAGAVLDPTAWIYAGIRNRLIDLWRRETLHRSRGETDVAHEVLEEIICDTGLDPADELIRDELADALADAIDALPQTQREVIVAQVFEEKTFREISAETGISADTLAARKRAAVKAISRTLRAWITED
ncbi:RNA polymerase sigma factor [Salinispira pacifica]